MKNGMVLIMVLVLAGMARGAISISPDAINSVNDPVKAAQVVGIGIQNDDGSISFIYLGQTNIGRQRSFTQSDTIQLFPDGTTILGLMLIGIHARRQRNELNLAGRTISI